jgi:uncharacterized SAM-binding protein YcdF (DUF218 family)
MTRRTRLRAVLAVPICCCLAWTGGFVWFLARAMQEPPPPPHSDGIVVFTGGAERVETGLRLLAAGDAHVLLVTGVGGGAGATRGEFAAIARHAGVDPGLEARTTLGREALDTHGNALETALWAAENNIHSLIVVTAGYHMPRAVAELSRALPEVDLHPYPVTSPALRRSPDAASLRLLAAEYTKYLVVASGLPLAGLRADDHLGHGEERRGG